ncbi:MAG: MFS transporter [Pseudomonadota bacterium]
MIAADQRQWWLLGAMSGVLGLIVLDETVVSVSLPSITRELDLSVSASHWVVNAYLLGFTCSVAIAGRLGDLFRRKSYFTAGAALFGFASLLAALAPNGTVLIGARGVQGIAAAMIFPTSLALITTAFPPNKRGVAFGYQTTVGGVFMASGPLLGGMLTQVLSWRMIFWVNIPVVLAITVLLWLIWSSDYDIEHPRTSAKQSGMDLLGPVFLVLCLFGLVAYVMQGPSWGWMSPASLVLMIMGITTVFLFLRRELKYPAPLFDLSLLKIPSFGGGAVIFAIFQLEKIAVFVFAAQFIQNHLGLTPVVSGAVVSLAVLPTLRTSVFVGKATDRLGSEITLVRGATIHGTAIVLLAAATMVQNFWLMLVPLVIWGASMPSIAIPVRRQQMNVVPADKHAQAGGINLTIQFIGGCLGLAACSALVAETQSYPLLFLAVGLLTILVAPIASRTMK